ncbi:cytochrome c biogenesis protein CcdA [Streptomyces sp. NA02950]|uniref:cytochrome c biogenesis CcdA family protein n=1 Tax=Streptomyces sp. NA02950 TaxID=2742137 RepID=UPI001590F2AC|nr:cytochrome c biogenesis protein CcdA [Streptomyces sp. NA02950]QKV93389.1 cytochrome c biogenesis protein CcdA [Streptomyces sp. NA02950]
MSTLAAVAGYNETVMTGGLLVSLPIAIFAGLVSFFSPCVLPLVPGYMSYVTGITGADLAEARRGRMLAGASLFVLGFSAVFVSGGALFGNFGNDLQAHRETLSKVLGVVTIVLGLAFMGVLKGFGQREFRFHIKPTMGLAGAPVLGVLFGVGWTPCLGPTLSAASFLAIQEGTAGRGALLVAAYCLGLGLPFIAVALAYRRTLGAFGWVKRHYVWVMRAGGGLLITLGVLMLTGVWDTMMGEMQGWAAGFNVGI